jgi:hypothetical protein
VRHNLSISQVNSPSFRGTKNNKRKKKEKHRFQHQHHLDNLQFLSILKKRLEALITGFDPRTGPDASTRQLL